MTPDAFKHIRREHKLVLRAPALHFHPITLRVIHTHGEKLPEGVTEIVLANSTQAFRVVTCHVHCWPEASPGAPKSRPIGTLYKGDSLSLVNDQTQGWIILDTWGPQTFMDEYRRGYVARHVYYLLMDKSRLSQLGDLIVKRLHVDAADSLSIPEKPKT